MPEAPTFAEDFPGPAARAAGAALSLEPSVFTEELAGSMPGGRFGKRGSGVHTTDGALEAYALHGPSMFKEEPKTTARGPIWGHWSDVSVPGGWRGGHSVRPVGEPSMFKEELAGDKPGGRSEGHWMGKHAAARRGLEPSTFKEELAVR